MDWQVPTVKVIQAGTGTSGPDAYYASTTHSGEPIFSAKLSWEAIDYVI